MGMPNKVRIVTDSDCDLPSSLLTRYGITAFPAVIYLGDRRFLDGVDLDQDAFYGYLARGEQPRNGPPDPDLMRRTYLELASGGDSIVSIHISRQYRWRERIVGQAPRVGYHRIGR